MDIRLLIVAYLMICTANVLASPYRSRSRNKNSSPTYDQKQTGEYNIQLHLKDFEVVALLSDSAFGEIGDYDYNYDYSELTVKPSGQHTTTTTTTTAMPTTSKRPQQKPETILPPTTPSSTTPAEIIIISSTTQPPSTQTSPTIQTTKNTPNEPQTTQRPIVIISSTSEKLPTNNPTSALPTNPPMRLENDVEVNATTTMVSKDNDAIKHSTIKTEIVVKPVENLTIIDNKEPANVNQEESLPLVVHRKCASGFTRDKLGRCRRVRRPPPQFSFGISRLATLASKLRPGTTDSTQSTSETENTEE